MKSKKADFMLGEYTLKMIIAVLCIILLLYLLANFYSSFTNNKNLSKATKTLDSLSKYMADAKLKPVDLPLVEPNTWVLISYSGIEKPEQCARNCICLCESYKTDSWKRGWVFAYDQLEKCEIKGVCKDFVDTINKFEITLRTNVNIEYKSGAYVISEKK